MSLLERRKTEEGTESPQEPRKKIELEKGDLPALLIAAFLNFILPIMLVLTAVCLLAYAFFTRLR